MQHPRQGIKKKKGKRNSPNESKDTELVGALGVGRHGRLPPQRIPRRRVQSHFRSRRRHGATNATPPPFQPGSRAPPVLSTRRPYTLRPEPASLFRGRLVRRRNCPVGAGAAVSAAAAAARSGGARERGWAGWRRECGCGFGARSRWRQDGGGETELSGLWLGPGRALCGGGGEGRRWKTREMGLVRKFSN